MPAPCPGGTAGTSARRPRELRVAPSHAAVAAGHVDEVLVLVVPDRHRRPDAPDQPHRRAGLGLGQPAAAPSSRSGRRPAPTGTGSCGSGRRRRRSGGCRRRCRPGSSRHEPQLHSLDDRRAARARETIAQPGALVAVDAADDQDLARRACRARRTTAMIDRPSTERPITIGPRRPAARPRTRERERALAGERRLASAVCHAAADRRQPSKSH